MIQATPNKVSCAKTLENLQTDDSRDSRVGKILKRVRLIDRLSPKCEEAKDIGPLLQARYLAPRMQEKRMPALLGRPFRQCPYPIHPQGNGRCT